MCDVLVECRKRSCEYNLGGHCETENAASVAAQWHYLNSPWSPGRRKRLRPADRRRPRIRRCQNLLLRDGIRTARFKHACSDLPRR